METAELKAQLKEQIVKFLNLISVKPEDIKVSCPECGKPSMSKMVTAAGFQLKGSGWYATDFKGGGTAKPAVDSAAAKEGPGSDGKKEAKSEAKADSKTETKSETKVEAKKDATPATPATGG